MRSTLFVLLISSLGAPLAGQTPLQELLATGGVPCEQFGHGLAIHGERIVVGAAAASEDPTLPCALGPGAAYVFDRDGSGWTQTQRLVPPDGGEGDEFGNSVDVWNNRIVVGSELHDGVGGQNSGAAYVFERQGGLWVQVAKLEPSDSVPLQSFARGVSISAGWIVCGTRLDSSLGLYQAGAAYVFKRNMSGGWDEYQKVYASDPLKSALFGNSVAIDGDQFVVGAFYAFNSQGVREGAAYVFQREGAAWNEVQKLNQAQAYPLAQFGRSVALQADQILVGSRADDGPGAAYVFEKSGSSWTQTAKLSPSDGQNDDEFGESVAIHGNYALVGARLAAKVPAVEGRAYFYQRQGTSWSESAILVPHTQGTQNLFGYNVAMTAHGAAVGAPFAEDALGSVCVLGIPGGVNYCTAGTSSSGCQAILSAEGIASASATTGFDLRASSVEGAKDGLFFIGTNGQQANSWGSSTSFQCVVPPVFRCGLLGSAGTAGLCDGFFEQDLNALWCSSCPKPLKNPGPGARVQAQLWYRDPQNTSNQTTSLSDAIEFMVEP